MKRNAAHTPGEWLAVGNKVTHSMDIIADICVCDPALWGQQHLVRSPAEQHANALLIASAPSMLRTLKAVLLFLDEGGGYGGELHEKVKWAINRSAMP